MTLDVKVPDIGDFAEVTVIELMVKPGDTVAHLNLEAAEKVVAVAGAGRRVRRLRASLCGLSRSQW